MFQGKTIHLCVCGGIAAYKAAELVRRFQKAGAVVRVAMTQSAQQFVGPLTFQSLTRHPVLTKTLDATEEMEMGHITFAQQADALVVAPATANMLAKAALGMGDGVVSTILLAANIPIIMAPAMNRVMYAQSSVQQNVAALHARGVHIVEPESGELACGDVGPGRLADYDDILARVHDVMTGRQPLHGRRVVVSAGPTREHIDPVRFLSNPSSGRMGVAVAEAALKAGAEVTLVHGPLHISIPEGITSVPVVSAEDMRQAMQGVAAGADAVFMAAAVADWTPESPSTSKRKKENGQWDVQWVRTTDILRELADQRGGATPILVGWAAETDDVVGYAREKLRGKGIDMVVANDVGRPDAGFESITNEVVLVTDNETVALPLQSKNSIAEKLIQWLVDRIESQP